MRALCLLALSGVLGCGGGTSVSGFAGVYSSTWSGTWQNITPNTQSGANTDAATITVTDEARAEIKLSWQIPPNPPSGSIIFSYTGSIGTATPGTGSGVTGNCFTGVLNGNQQTDCCDTCTVAFTGNTFSQANAGHYSGTTPQGIAYTGRYSGVWTGTRQ